MSSVPTPTPTAYHGPAWELTHKGRDYLLWGPSDRRDHWQACWDSHKGLRGDCRRGATLADVLVIFPDDVAETFVVAVSQ